MSLGKIVLRLWGNSIMKRGILTESSKEKITDFMGECNPQRVLRLMPYLHHCLMNGSRIETRRMDEDEIALLELLEDNLALQIVDERLACCKALWELMSACLYDCYVAKTNIFDMASELLEDLTEQQTIKEDFQI